MVTDSVILEVDLSCSSAQLKRLPCSQCMSESESEESEFACKQTFTCMYMHALCSALHAACAAAADRLRVSAIRQHTCTSSKQY